MIDISKIFVTVVMPIYNRERTMKASIESVLNQTFTNFEFIIVNDASTDGTVKKLKMINDNRIRIIDMPYNSGANAARNRGIYESRGDYIAFIDSDDCWMQNKLQEQIEYMVTQKLMASFTPYQFSSTKEIVPPDFMEYNNNFDKIKNKLRLCNIVGTPTLIIKKTITEVVGVFDENLPRLQDYEYAIRIVKKYKIGCYPKILLSVSTATSDRISDNRDGLYIAMGIIISKHYNFLNMCDNNAFLRYLFTNDELDGDSLQKIVFNCHKHKNEFLKAVINAQATIIKRNNFIINEIKKRQINDLVSGKFIIWGAGKQGKEVYNDLKKIGKYPQYFVVSGNPTEQYIDGIKVMNINQVSTEKYDVLLGVARNTQKELLSHIEQYRFKSVIIR